MTPALRTRLRPARILRAGLVTACLLARVAAQEPPGPPAPAAVEAAELRPVASALEAQVELHRRGFSCGAIDGVWGAQTRAALQAFQRSAELPATDELDAATRALLQLTAPALTEHTVTAGELAEIAPLPDTWLGKSEQPTLAFASILELVAERLRAAPNFLRRANPAIEWDAVTAGTVLQVTAVERTVIGDGARPGLVIRLAAHEREVHDAHGTRVDKADPHLLGGEQTRLSVSLPQLPPGQYTVIWHVTSVDTHKTEGRFIFSVTP